MQGCRSCLQDCIGCKSAELLVVLVSVEDVDCTVVVCGMTCGGAIVSSFLRWVEEFDGKLEER